MTRRISIVCFVFLAVLAGVSGAGENETAASGSFTLELSKPVDDKTSEQAREGARRILSRDVFDWLKTHTATDWDTVNAVDRAHFQAFVTFCIPRAHQGSSFDGPRWTFSFTLDQKSMISCVSMWNNMYDSLAMRSYRELSAADESGDIRKIYITGIKTVFYCRARLGPPMNTPGELAKDLSEDARKITNRAIDKLAISSNNMVVAGTPGRKPIDNLYISVKLDSMPFDGMHLEGFLPDGRRILSAYTNIDGDLPLSVLRVPYVSNGTFFYIRSNPGWFIEPSLSCTHHDLNLGLSRNLEQVLMFKVSRPNFSLNYRANAVSDMTIPAEFTESRFLSNFLRDSCHMTPASQGTTPDIIFDVTWQVSHYHYDEREETVVRVASKIAINEKQVDSPRHIEGSASFEKPYKIGVDVPIGLFFWEAAKSLFAEMKNTLYSLQASGS